MINKMGNMMGCYRESKTTNDIVPEILSSSGHSETNATTSCSENSGISFGSQPSCGGDSLLPLSAHIFEKPNLRVFTFSELKSATGHFKPHTLLGEGGFGKVYKGWIHENTLLPLASSTPASKIPVAIKKLNSQSIQGFQEWQSEVNFLGRLSHPNLVKLLGYCWEDKELLLVYEYLPKGSLENHLFRRNHSMEPLSWERRMSIALGVAKGMAFLHSSEEQVIYRDFKTSNILLDANYDAKISDFGLAKLGPSVGNSHVTTRVMGTYGYAAPEYIATGHLYVSSDVYGFGVVLLEMLTGLRALDTNRPSGQHSLVEWAKPCVSSKRRLKTIMDIRLEGQYSFKAAFELGQLIFKCLVHDPKSRPSMKEIVETLEKIEGVKGKQKEIKKKRDSDESSVYYNPSLYRPQKLGPT